jgi:hypothetical protein
VEILVNQTFSHGGLSLNYKVFKSFFLQSWYNQADRLRYFYHGYGQSPLQVNSGKGRTDSYNNKIK